MKKTMSGIILCVLFVSVGFAQPQKKFERIHAAKMVYVTDRIHLTTEQTGNFIPLYKEYEKEIWDLRQQYKQKKRDSSQKETDDAESRRLIDDNLDYQEKVIQVKRKYNDRFLKVISAQQLADMYVAEREFRQWLRHQMDRNHGDERGGGGGWRR